MDTDYTTSLFVCIDDFYKAYEAQIQQSMIAQWEKIRKPTRVTKLTTSEICTIYLLFYNSGFANFKRFYLEMLRYHRKKFPNMPTYDRFIVLIKRIFLLMMHILKYMLDSTSDIAYIDSTPIRVRGNKRTSTHKVFKDLAKLGKSSVGWFFGFKLHLVIDLSGKLKGFMLTPANANDRNPVENLLKNFKGTVCGDKGYISAELFQKLFAKWIKLVTGIKKGMENKLLELNDKILLRKRSLIESVIGLLKRNFSLEHSRHRSVANFCCHIVAALLAYQLSEYKPHISWKNILTNP